jgi:hypothetical protein
MNNNSKSAIDQIINERNFNSLSFKLISEDDLRAALNDAYSRGFKTGEHYAIQSKVNT